MPQYTSIDLFAGPGGLCTGFRWAGIRALIAVEWSYWTAQTYAASHNAEIFNLSDYLNGEMQNPDQYFRPSDRTLLIYGDINLVDDYLIRRILRERFCADSVDIVTGGAPCESFSMAGARKEDDKRNGLYKNVIRIAKAADAKMFMFENVKGLFSKKLNGVAGDMYKSVCREFQNKESGQPSFTLASSDKDTVLLKASDYGVPQNRERLILVGLNDKLKSAAFAYPRKTHGPGREFDYVSVNDAIMDLPQIESGQDSVVYDFCGQTCGARKSFLERMRGAISMPPSHIVFNVKSLFNHKAPGHTDKRIK